VLFTFLSLSLSLFPCVVDAKTKSTLTKAHKVSRFFYCVACEGRTTWTPQRKERTQRKQRDSRDFRTDSVARDTRKETTRVQRKKQHEKFLSLFLSRALQSFVLSVAFGRYESSLINLFLLQEESFHDERRREKGKFRLYYISSRRRRIVFLVFVGEF
jgi:hypothetical protein